jgi:hypothetical protein
MDPKTAVEHVFDEKLLMEMRSKLRKWLMSQVNKCVNAGFRKPLKTVITQIVKEYNSLIHPKMTANDVKEHEILGSIIKKANEFAAMSEFFVNQ